MRKLYQDTCALKIMCDDLIARIEAEGPYVHTGKLKPFTSTARDIDKALTEIWRKS